MKKMLAFAAALLFGCSTCSCSYLLYSLRHTQPDAIETEVEIPAETQPMRLDMTFTGDTRVTEIELTGEYPEEAHLYGRLTDTQHMDVVGRFGAPVSIVDADNVTGAQLVFHYNPDNMQNVPPENLIVLHYLEDEQFYETIPSALDTGSSTVTADTVGAGVYMLADAYQWGAAWGEDVSGYAHDAVYTSGDFGFEITIPKEIQMRPVGDYLKKDEAGKCQTLLECEPDDTFRVGIEYLERPYYDSCKEFVNDICAQLDQNGYLKDTGKLEEKSGVTGYYYEADFGEDTGGSINAIFPMSDTQYINVWYGFKDASLRGKVMDSLQSFRFTKEVQLAPPDTFSSQFDHQIDITGKDISLLPPEGVTAEPYDGNWFSPTEEATTRNSVALMQFKGTSTNVRAAALLFEDSGQSARKAAAEDLNYLKQQGAVNATSSQIQMSDQLNGYLFRAEQDRQIQLRGYYEVPDSSRYVRATIYLLPSAPQEEQDAYWKMLESVDTTKSDALVSPENLVLQLPKNLVITPSEDHGWTNEGDGFYRKWLYDTDHNASSQLGNGYTDYCASFFYLIDTGRPAKEDMQSLLDKNLASDYHDFAISDQAEVTLSDGQKGYLFALREKEPKDYASCYMYGFYEVVDAEGALSTQYVEIEFWLNEPMSDSVYQDYWNCLKTADIRR